MTQLNVYQDSGQNGMTEPTDDRDRSPRGTTKSKPVNQVEFVIKFVSHVFGASILILPFAMAQVGIGQYLIVLVMELYFTGNSLKFFCEMAPHEHGIDHTNYFVIAGRYLTKNHKDLVHYLLSGIFIIDAVVCTAFYFETAFELFHSPCLAESTNPNLRSGYRTFTFVSVAFFLFIIEIANEFIVRRKKLLGGQYELNTNFNVQNSNIGEFHVTLDDKSKEDKTRDINMQAVVQRLHGFSWLRCVQLLLIFFLIYSQFEISRNLQNDERVEAFNMSQCPGLLEPFFWDELNIQIFHVILVIIFSLMHYAIFLPICLEELRLPPKEYAGLVTKASLLLLVILTIIPLFVHVALGGSAPVLFTTAYGCTPHGMGMNCLALLISLNAMLLRIIPCCRLIQVLFGWESDSHFLVIKICLLAASFLLASTIESVLHLVIMAGFCSIVLIIIIPRVTYIRFKLQQDNSCINFEIVQIGLCVAGHMLLLPPAVAALLFADPNVGQNCHKIFDEYWSSDVW